MDMYVATIPACNRERERERERETIIWYHMDFRHALQFLKFNEIPIYIMLCR